MQGCSIRRCRRRRSPASTWSATRDGELRVLEDNLRMPSGAAYALAVREIVEPELGAAARPRPLGGYLEQLGEAIRAAAPDGPDEPVAAILSDGPENGAWYEHERIGRELGLPVVTPDQLEVEPGTALRPRHGRERAPGRRHLPPPRRGPPQPARRRASTALGELLLPALRSGRLRCVNAFGTGLADDKLAHAYVERMVRFYLGEEPLLRSVPSFDLCDESDRERGDGAARRAGGQAARRLRRPRGDDHAAGERAGAQARDRGWCGGGPSTSSPRSRSRSPPTRRSAAARLRPRRIDLRPFVVSAPATGRRR